MDKFDRQFLDVQWRYERMLPDESEDDPDDEEYDQYVDCDDDMEVCDEKFSL